MFKSKLKPLFGARHETISNSADVEAPQTSYGTLSENGGKGPTAKADDAASEAPTEDAQEGVKAAEAITLVWTKTSLIVAYFFILLVYFVNSLAQQIGYNLTAYVTSDFSSHSLIAVIGVASSLMSGVLQIPTAKVLDIWGRSEGFAVMTLITTLGLVLMAVCTNVQTYAAATVFYTVGFTGMNYVLSVVVADTSSLKNRALAFGLTSCPYIATAFAGPAAAESFYNTSGFRWAFGCFAIVVPVTSLPICYLLFSNQRKAKKIGVLQKESSGRSAWESIVHYIVEFDAMGVILLSAGLVLFLLPFSLAGSAADSWATPSIIAEIVVGFVLLVLFVLYERFLAPTPYIPFGLLTSPSVAGACLLAGTLFVGFYCWDGYYTSYLQVVHGLSISEAGYVGNIYDVGSCFWSVVVGILIRVSGRYKWLAWVALPLQCLGGGLMIYFRQPYTHIGYVIMCQIFIAFAGGTLVICEQMAVMAVAEHGQIAALLALLSLSASIGGGIGSSLSGAIWTNTLPVQLALMLPDYALPDLDDIYEDLATQLSYPVGDPVRTAIIEAYGVTQQRMCIAGTAVLALGFLGVAFWKDVRVKDFKQTKGLVF